jgi:hypothetical protein
MKKKIFISFSEIDSEKLLCIKESKIINKDFHPIIATDVISPSKSLSNKVRQGIEECIYFIPLITKNSINAQWMNQEIGFALGRKKWIIPLVESGIEKNLKGFIHDQLDLTFVFNDEKKSSTFEAILKKLTSYLLDQEKQTIQDLFPGRWECHYKGKIHNGSEIVTIIDSVYHKSGTATFDIENVRIDLVNKKFFYTKIGKEGTPSKGRVIKGEMTIKEKERQYKGIEVENNDETKIDYFKIN